MVVARVRYILSIAIGEDKDGEQRLCLEKIGFVEVRLRYR